MGKGDKIKGGFADKISAEDIAKKHKVSVKDIQAQIKMGRKVELEHVDDKELAEEIALDHLYEIPDYYTRLNKMEKEAKKDMKEKEVKTEGKENITEFARRMRELAGLSEGNQKKSLKTIQEGVSSYIDADGDKVYDLSIDISSIEELVDAAKYDEELESFLRTELSSNEGVRVINGMVFWGSDIFDHLRDEPRLGIDENQEDYELEDRKQQYGINPEIEMDDFESIDFEQGEIEEGEDDSELYNLNENTTIILDFLDDEDGE